VARPFYAKAWRRGSRRLRRLRRYQRSPLTFTNILAWADAFYARWGCWPNVHDPRSVGVAGEAWSNIDGALRKGFRGLPGGSSLARFLDDARGKRNHKDLPPLTPYDLRRWAVAHKRRTGDWPHQTSGAIPGAPGETWSAIDGTLSRGGRGFPGGSSLAQFLAAECGVPNPQDRPRLHPGPILAWADAFHQRAGCWPTARSGPIPESPGDTWAIVDDSLREGIRGLPGGSSLARLLAAVRGVPNPADRPGLTLSQVWAWAQAHHQRTGCWPTRESGTIPEAPAETWCGIAQALGKGRRGLPGGLSLGQLLAARRGILHPRDKPLLSASQIVAWARAHYQRTGLWPTAKSGSIPESMGDTWKIVEGALHQGGRGLPGGSSIARLLAQRCGKPNPAERPPLTEDLILAWADRHHRLRGRWPTGDAGPVAGVRGEKWCNIAAALQQGHRGLPGNSSLAQLLARHRGVRNRKQLPRFSQRRILRWARAHRARTGRWPTASSGEVIEAPGETWNAIDNALRAGCRGLPGGSSLYRLLQQQS
jgi:hypothetical protein